MGDTLKKVQTGDALVIPAQTFNTFIDAARDFRSRQQGRAQNAQQTFRSSGIILVKNASGYDQDRFAVLGIDSPIITPTGNEDEFKNRRLRCGISVFSSVVIEALPSVVFRRIGIRNVFR